MFKADELIQRSVVLIKPDGVARGIIGELITRFEKAGFKIVAMKMVWVDKELVNKHYPESRTELMKAIGTKTLESYAKYGKDPNEELGTMDPIEIGKMVNKWNIEFLSSGPVVAMLLEGIHAIESIRMIVGHTIPAVSQPGTIRGDYSIDSPALANARKRPLRNLVHASGNEEEAKYEVELWFRKEEIYSYKRADEDVMFG
ncbi:MAG: nucleoside-diphosphate kinase [Candidatus Komeilibacteria bacterium]|nr:nucleoside-diphosphate kinase [Candidatus Komeilibacteria bacterium]